MKKILESKILYKISFWYGLVCLVLSLLEIGGLYWLYKAQGISMPVLGRILSTNTFAANFLWFSGLVKYALFYSIITFVSLSLLRGKSKINRTTNVATAIISITACLNLIFIIIGAVSMIFSHSFLAGINLTYYIKGLVYPMFPLISLVAGFLLAMSYINERLDSSPRKYFQIILPSLAMLILIFGFARIWI